MKILVACGNGLGSSLMLEIKINNLLKEHGIEAEVAHTDLASAKFEQADIYIGSEDIVSNIEKDNVIGLQNIMSDEEIYEKLIKTIKG